MYRYYAHGEVLEEEVAPVVLDVEKEAKDQRHVHNDDEDHHHHPSVYRHRHCLFVLIFHDLAKFV